MSSFRSCGGFLWNSDSKYQGAPHEMTFHFYEGSLETEQWQTTIRHVTFFPTCGRIRCVTPESIILSVRVTTVVAIINGFFRKLVIFVVGMCVWRLWRPGLALFAAHSYRYVADVLTSIRWRIAVSTCTPYIQPVILLYKCKNLTF